MKFVRGPFAFELRWEPRLKTTDKLLVALLIALLMSIALDGPVWTLLPIFMVGVAIEITRNILGVARIIFARRWYR